MILLAHGHFEIFGEMPENTQNDVFLGAFNGFLAGEPRLGCRKVDSRFLYLDKCHVTSPHCVLFGGNTD